MSFTGKLSQTKFFKQYISFAEKGYPILDQNSLISIPYSRVNSLKTIPFTAAHTYIAHIWEYPYCSFDSRRRTSGETTICFLLIVEHAESEELLRMRL